MIITFELNEEEKRLYVKLYDDKDNMKLIDFDFILLSDLKSAMGL